MSYSPARFICDWIVSAGMGGESTCRETAAARFDTHTEGNVYEPNPRDLCERHLDRVEEGWTEIPMRAPQTEVAGVCGPCGILTTPADIGQPCRLCGVTVRSLLDELKEENV